MINIDIVGFFRHSETLRETTSTYSQENIHPQSSGWEFFDALGLRMN